MSGETTLAKLKSKANQIRKDVLEMCSQAGTGHVNSSYSIVEILVALYHGGILNHDPKNPDKDSRDRFILSKGQASPVLYCVLADVGYYPRDWCDGFNADGGKFAVHLQHTVPGVELTTGSLGHGLGVAAGMAHGLKLKRELPFVFCIIGDAECYEGSIWETAAFASHNRLNNLVVFLDRNCLGATDFTENACSLEDFEAKWDAFGWDTVRIDGHSFVELAQVLHNVKGRSSTQPLMIICDTIKGKGIEELTNAPLWHSKTPTGEQAKQAMEELS